MASEHGGKHGVRKYWHYYEETATRSGALDGCPRVIALSASWTPARRRRYRRNVHDFVVLHEETGALDVFKCRPRVAMKPTGSSTVCARTSTHRRAAERCVFLRARTTVGRTGCWKARARAPADRQRGLSRRVRDRRAEPPYGTSMYDLFYEKLPPLVPPRLTEEVRERVLFDGSVHVPFDEASARTAIERLAAHGVESAAVCLLFSFRNGDHERRILELFAELAPQIDVSLSCDVAPEIREYYRLSTAVVNAYLNRSCAATSTRLRSGWPNTHRREAKLRDAVERGSQRSPLPRSAACRRSSAARPRASWPRAARWPLRRTSRTSSPSTWADQHRRCVDPKRRARAPHERKVHGRDVLVPCSTSTPLQPAAERWRGSTLPRPASCPQSAARSPDPPVWTRRHAADRHGCKRGAGLAQRR